MHAWVAILLFIPVAAFCDPCESCHPKEVKNYARTGMGRSLHAPRAEPDGGFEHAKSKTSFLIRSNKAGLFQRMTHAGETFDYRIDYVIGSGAHASCYAARVGDHLFQSPICFYKSRGYDMAPGYEDNPAPGFSRPITIECLQCHSGRPVPVPNSVNRYATPAFTEEAISCDRCHGDTAAHLNRPSRGNIVNPRKLAAALRDAVCEQCHLSGITRVLNPGKSFTDFRPGQPLEDVFTTYIAGGSDAFTVVSHSEQLARSRCSLQSKGRMWCGSCHNPHSETTSYRQQCLSCHTRPLPAAHPARSSDCLPCHMPKRKPEDGGHTAFTDHWIKRRPSSQTSAAKASQLVPWREPRSEYRARNLALALADYKSLLEVQKSFPTDPAVLSGIGAALQTRGDPRSAAKMFERVIELRPLDPIAQENAGMAWLEAGDNISAAQHFEKALALDPLLLPDIEALQKIYREAGDREKETALMNRVRQAMQTRAK